MPDVPAMRVFITKPDGGTMEVDATFVAVQGRGPRARPSDHLTLQDCDALAIGCYLKTENCKIEDHNGYVIPNQTTIRRGDA